MSTIVRGLVMGALLLIVAGNVSGETPRDPALLQLEPLTFSLPKAVEKKLENGLRVLVFENHDLPLVTLSARITMGRYFVPLEKATSVTLLSRLWDEGGAGDYDPTRLDSLVESMGMTLSAWVGDQEGRVTAYMAREDLAQGASLWRDLLLRPGFAKDRLERSKTRKIKDLQSINDDPQSLAETWFWRLMAGRESAEGRVSSRASIAAVTADDLRALHQQFVVPVNTVIGVAGDITPDEAVKLLASLLGDWVDEADVAPAQVTFPRRQGRPGVFVLPGQYKQCHFRLGRTVPGLTELNPDYPAVKIADFGVGFLRVYYRTRQEGLSYGTGARLIADSFQGTCMALGSTRPEKIVDLLQVVLEEVAGVEDHPLTDIEVETARNFQSGAFIQDLETDQDIIDLRLREITLGFPDGYYQRFFASQQSVNPLDVEAVTKRYFSLGEHPVLVVVGTPEGGVETLTQLGLGPVQILEPENFGE